MSSTTKILIGLFVGIAVGVFFGEEVAFLKVVGDGFIALLQMTVLPYIVVSLLGGIGRLSFETGKSMIRAAVLTLVGFLLIGTIVVATAPFAFPERSAGAFFRSSLLEEPAAFDFVSTYIPANPFASLANNVVPAVVLFCFLVGVAIAEIPLRRKKVLLGALEVLTDALNRVNKLVLKLTPLGIFAIAASTAGTMTVEEISRLQVYVVSYTLIGIVLGFVILPILITSFTSFGYREIFRAVGGTLITIFATAKIIVVLPELVDNVKELFARKGLDSEEGDQATEILFPLAYPFPNLGTFAIMMFVPFASWYVGSELSGTSMALFLGSLAPSSFVAPIAGVPFLLDLVRVPADMFDLFMISTVYTDRIRVVVGAISLVALTTITVMSMRGELRLGTRSAVRAAVVCTLSWVATLALLKAFFSFSVGDGGDQYRDFIQMDLKGDRAPALQLQGSSAVLLRRPAGQSRLDAIRRSAKLRVGFPRDHLPFAFVNSDGRYVGLEVDMMHALARDLGVTLEIVRLDSGQGLEWLQRGELDVLIGGNMITAESALDRAFTHPYMEQTLGFVVPDYRRSEFATRKALDALASPRIGYVKGNAFLSQMPSLAPSAQLIKLDSPRTFLRGKRPDLDALLFGAEAGSAWTLVYPDYSVAVPLPSPVRLPVALVIPRNSIAWTEFLNEWLEVQQSTGNTAALVDHWILGEGASRRRPRWSVIRDVLHWVD